MSSTRKSEETDEKKTQVRKLDSLLILSVDALVGICLESELWLDGICFLDRFAFPREVMRHFVEGVSRPFRQRMAVVHADIIKHGFIKRFIQTLEHCDHKSITCSFNVDKLYPWCVFGVFLSSCDQTRCYFRQSNNTFRFCCCDMSIGYADGFFYLHSFRRRFSRIFYVDQNNWAWPLFRARRLDYLSCIRRQMKLIKEMDCRHVRFCERGSSYFFKVKKDKRRFKQGIDLTWVSEKLKEM